jgi:CheY-like chemotaxis protein
MTSTRQHFPFVIGQHAVQFYEREERLADTIAAFFAQGLRRGDRLVMISSPWMLDLVSERLAGTELGSASEAAGRILFRDAQASLPQLMDGNRLDRERAERAFDDLLSVVRPGGSREGVWIYGNMVDLLCKQHNHTDAVRLEALWNELSVKYEPVTVLCSYAVDHFDDEADANPLRAICRQHTHGNPAYGYSGRLCEQRPLEQIALLEQRARTSGHALRRWPSPGSVVATIYVIEDHSGIRRSLERLLEPLALPIRTFASVEEFLERVDATARGCLILDLRLEGMQGPELQYLLTSARWPLPVIVMSAEQGASCELEARRRGAKAFLRKPFEARALLDAIAQVLT